jgi:cupin 2 domain-containing protein
MESGNFFENYPFSEDEIFEDILKNKNFKIERIVSRGHITPEDEWYNQETDEWVMLLTGSAKLLFDKGEELKMKPGDFINIPAHKKHKVIFTDTNEDSIWLAVHYKS